MCAFFGILGMGLSNEQCENCLVRLVTLYVNCVLKLQVCFAFDEQPQAHNFVTIYGTIFLFLELSVPLQEKKTAVINHSCQYKCRSFEPGMEKKIKVCGIYDNSKLGFVKKRGANKNSYLLPIFLSDLLPKKRIRNPTQTQYINFQNRGRSPKNIRHLRL